MVWAELKMWLTSAVLQRLPCLFLFQRRRTLENEDPDAG